MLFEKKKNSREEVKKEVKKIIYNIMKSYEREELEDQTEAFFEQLDSLRIIELVVLTEKKFKISFTTEQLTTLADKKFDTYVDLILDCLEEVA